jgi:hypothetical protein
MLVTGWIATWDGKRSTIGRLATYFVPNVATDNANDDILSHKVMCKASVLIV